VATWTLKRLYVAASLLNVATSRAAWRELYAVAGVVGIYIPRKDVHEARFFIPIVW
jgi:hypothetical protein